ncbi:MAG TPA: carbon-nitrogen hydrolase family protein [Bacteroidales bacterium]|jgi:predicted amidohydrolase|nr:carbon-nitrogen hydrolase family protein [Bacteroidales bacterium]HPM86399.1 carbon-nitrogen hydrolase family protein [Bacteroidales bacterium]
MNNRVLTLLFVTGLLTGPGIAKADNLILNPGFEASPVNPVSWKITGPVESMQPTTTVDNNIFFSGRSGLKMESSNPNCHGRAVQTFGITGDQTYLVTARFRTENISSVHKNVLIRVKWFRGKEQLGYNYIYTIEGESDGWFHASDRIKAVKGSTTAELSLEFRWSTGTVWWDDISFEACAEELPRKIKVGTFYFRPPGPTVEKNIALMSEMIDKAGKEGCTIICLPEGWPTCNTGLGMQKTESNTLEGSASAMMSEKAKEYGMYIVSGLYSWKGDTLKNVAVLYGRTGKIEGIYEKVQLPDSETEAGAVPGNTFPVFTTDFGRIGILICWDSAFPEISRILAINGAEILFCPVWGDVRGPESWKLTARARAFDNGVYFVTNIFDGHSVIVNPAGDILQESGIQGTLITSEIDLNFNPPWNWIGNAGLGIWKGVWRKDRRADLFGILEE